MDGGRTYVYKAFDSNVEYKQLTSTVRCVNTRTGIVARSPLRICKPIKTEMSSPKPISVPQTFELLHA